MNTRKWTVRLVILTLTCFLLSYASSVLGNLNSEKSFPHSLFTQYTKTIGNSQSVEIEKRLDAGDLSEIEIQTAQTDVEVQTVSAPQITLGLKGHYISRSNHPESVFKVHVDGAKLIVEINENDIGGSKLFNFSDGETDGKLVLTVPPNISKLKIRTVSGDISLAAMKLANLNIDTVSGDTLLSQTAVDQLQFKSVSGGIAGSGFYLQANIRSISGGAKLTFINANPIVEFKSTSGDLEVLFSKIPDVNLQFATISGGFELDPHFGPEQNERKKVQMILGAGIGKISVNTISGDFKIVQKID